MKIIKPAIRAGKVIIIAAQGKTCDEIGHTAIDIKARSSEVGYAWTDTQDGFITSEGEFVDRIEAGKIALANGQSTELSEPPYLYSEDIWEESIND